MANPTTLQPTSQHRLNSMAVASTASSISAYSDPFRDSENASPRPSPTRTPAAKLFADYDPRRNSPVKESGFALPASPSLPEIYAFKRSHVRTNSDVQGLVKRFEHLDVRDRDAESSERRKRHEAELRRAQVAREEAELDAKRLREEVRRLRKDGDEGRERERKVAKRLEVVMDEFTTFKESQTSQHNVYEKEVRKARKEAFKNSSEVVKLREELKSTRNSLRITQSGLDMEKRKVQQKEQQTFDAQYQLVALHEQLDRLQTHIKTVEQEKEALKTSLKEEEVARIAAEGMIALPIGGQGDDDLMSPKIRRQSPNKRARSPDSDDKENAGVVTKKMVEAKQLAEELRWEKMRREQAEELADFLRLECKFKCCGCRSRRDSAVASAVEEEKPPKWEVPGPEDVRTIQGFELSHEHGRKDTVMEDHAAPSAEEIPQEPPSEQQKDLEPSTQHAEEEADDNDIDQAIESTIHQEEQEEDEREPPETPHIRTVTTTTTIPMQFTPVRGTTKLSCHPAIDAETVPVPTMSPDRGRSGSAPTFDREAALAAIAYRRGRAKSIANGHTTPRKPMVGISRHVTR